MDFQKLEQDIVRRLAAIDVSGEVDKPSVAAALDQVLDALTYQKRSIAWARDGLHAHELVAQADLTSVDHFSVRTAHVLGTSQEREDPLWVEARDKARDAGHGAQFEFAKILAAGSSVKLSIPWRAYTGESTGDRGARSDPHHESPWSMAAEALEYAARAAAECALAQSDGDTARNHAEAWLPFAAAFEAGLWCFWMTADDVIALPRPAMKLSGGQLHSEHGPAISWPGSEQEYFFLNGTNVPREIVETPASELDPRRLLKEWNAEVRRELVRKIGIERVCEVLEAQCLDRQGNYELLLLDLQDGRQRPYLKMKNPSIGVYHIEGVAPECRTVAEALAWRNQSDVPPSVLT